MMTPEQKIKHAIVVREYEFENQALPVVTSKNIDDLYDEIVASGAHYDWVSEMREGEVSTGIECDYSRHYESRSVASQMPDGSWVGWTYWYGGGKHANPNAIDWMSLAYDLNLEEREEVVVVREFTKAKTNA